MKVDILVLNYNGEALLKEFLPSICEAADKSNHDCRVYVIDNLSNDGSLSLLREKFPEVSVIAAKENKVLCSYNDVVNDLDSDAVIFLNNDMKVKQDFVDHLIMHFDDKNVMFAAPRVMNFDNTFNGGKSYLEFKKGAIRVVVDYDSFMEGGGTQSIATGAFRRDLFSALGGFDDIYLPGIWEDVDICYRGQKCGFTGVYEPKSVIWHKESTTFHREYGRRKKMRIAHRNMYLFLWKNIRDTRILITSSILAIPRAFAMMFRGKPEVLEGFIMALLKMPYVLKKKKMSGSGFFVETKKDKELLNAHE